MDTWVKKVELVTASFNRIEGRPGFAREFYGRFFRLNPKLKEYFHDTDFEHQEKLLLQGMKYIIEFLDPANERARVQVIRLSQSHSAFGMKIHPHHYFYWIEALVRTLEDYDPSWHDQLEQYWREVVFYPISFMMSQYFNKPS